MKKPVGSVLKNPKNIPAKIIALSFYALIKIATSRMRYILFIGIILSSCSTSQKLPSGMWSGYLSQMDQPDKQTPLNCKVKHLQENVSLEIFGPGGVNIPTKELLLTKDTLFFSFDKLSNQMLVSCALKKVGKNYYYGRCTDTDGKWGLLSMKYDLNPNAMMEGHFKGIRCICHN